MSLSWQVWVYIADEVSLGEQMTVRLLKICPLHEGDELPSKSEREVHVVQLSILGLITLQKILGLRHRAISSAVPRLSR